MSTEHPLTEEQLNALVDEIQDRLGDSTAQKYGRRGVLAALGVAALGTGSASGQASGAVGTSSEPVDAFAYNLDVQNGAEFNGTDISGVGSFSTAKVNSKIICSTASEIESELANASSHRIEIEPGSYAINNPIKISGGVILEGAGKDQTVLNCQNDDFGIIVDIDSGIADLDGFTLVGQDGSTGNGLDIRQADRFFLSNINTNSHAFDGLNIQNGNLSVVRNVEANANGRDGIRTGGVDANAVTFINPDCRSNTEHGWNNQGSYNATVLGGYAAANGLSGFNQDDTNSHLIGVGGEGNGDDDVVIKTDFNYASIGQGTHRVDANPATVTVISRGGGGEGTTFAARNGVFRGSAHSIDNPDTSGRWEFTQNASNKDLLLDLVSTSAEFVNFVLRGDSSDFETTGAGRGVVVEDNNGSGDKYRITVDGGSVTAQGPL